MRLTRRGRVVAGICAAAFIMAWLAGSRSLNAVVLPGLVALVAAYVQLRSVEPPQTVRDPPPDGFVGETHRVRLRFFDRPGGAERGLRAPFVATVSDAVGDGVESRGATTEAAVGDGAVEYEVTYRERGERTLGPVRLRVRDVFGLAERELVCRGTTRVLVYPERKPVPTWFRQELFAAEEVGQSRQRDEFDGLREYGRGDPLRDVHWPTVAKRNELVVKEFAADAESSAVAVAGGATAGGDDELATAVCSVALALLDDGIPVTVSLPNGRVRATGGAEERRRLLELLATTTVGRVPEPDADVAVEADRGEVTLRFGDRSFSFDRLVSAGARGRYASGDGRAGPGESDGRARPAADGAESPPAAADGGEP